MVSVLQSLATAGIWFAIVWLPILLVLGVVDRLVVWIGATARARVGACRAGRRPRHRRRG